MQIIRTLVTILAVFGLATALTACGDEGPMERAGEAIDDAATDVADSAEDATDKVKDSMD
jgi:predicted small lipoprotein YifL